MLDFFSRILPSFHVDKKLSITLRNSTVLFFLVSIVEEHMLFLQHFIPANLDSKKFNFRTLDEKNNNYLSIGPSSQTSKNSFIWLQISPFKGRASLFIDLFARPGIFDQTFS